MLNIKVSCFTLRPLAFCLQADCIANIAKIYTQSLDEGLIIWIHFGSQALQAKHSKTQVSSTVSFYMFTLHISIVPFTSSPNCTSLIKFDGYMSAIDYVNHILWVIFFWKKYGEHANFFHKIVNVKFNYFILVIWLWTYWPMRPLTNIEYWNIPNYIYITQLLL